MPRLDSRTRPPRTLHHRESCPRTCTCCSQPSEYGITMDAIRPDTPPVQAAGRFSKAGSGLPKPGSGLPRRGQVFKIQFSLRAWPGQVGRMGKHRVIPWSRRAGRSAPAMGTPSGRTGPVRAAAGRRRSRWATRWHGRRRRKTESPSPARPRRKPPGQKLNFEDLTPFRRRPDPIPQSSTGSPPWLPITRPLRGLCAWAIVRRPVGVHHPTAAGACASDRRSPVVRVPTGPAVRATRGAG